MNRTCTYKRDAVFAILHTSLTNRLLQIEYSAACLLKARIVKPAGTAVAMEQLCEHIVARMRRLYNAGYWIDNWIYWITHSYSVYTSQLTIAAATLL
jgi:hypothetical protein